MTRVAEFNHTAFLRAHSDTSGESHHDKAPISSRNDFTRRIDIPSVDAHNPYHLIMGVKSENKDRFL
jgi:hypothetical protein